MKLHQEDPRLTAYLLGELPPGEAAAVGRAADSDPAVRKALKETEVVSSQLQQLFGGGREELLPHHRGNIRRAAKEAARAGKIEVLKSHRHARKNRMLPLAAAAVIAAGIFLLTMIPSPKAAGKGQVAANVKTPIEQSGVKAEPRVGNITRLPLEAGKRSLARITHAIRIEERMPKSDEVQIEELLNAFPLKVKDSVALWKGCSLGAEILPCPWKPSGNLILVSVQGANDAERKLSVEFRANEANVGGHRLLGYSGGKTDGGKSSESILSGGQSLILAIETDGSGENLGQLVWTVDGTEAPPLDLVVNREKEPSNEGSFSALVCAFGLWLRGEGKPAVDDMLVLGLAREAAAESLVADRYDFLALVDQAIKMSEK